MTPCNRAHGLARFTPLREREASLQGHLAVVEALLRAGADKEAKNADGVTLLYGASAAGHLAVVQGHPAVVQALLRAVVWTRTTGSPRG